PGDIGGFSLVAYEDVRPRAAAIARATRSRAMPPWKPEPGRGEFAGARRLTDQQIDIIQRWVADGAIEGDRRDLPPPPQPADDRRVPGRALSRMDARAAAPAARAGDGVAARSDERSRDAAASAPCRYAAGGSAEHRILLHRSGAAADAGDAAARPREHRHRRCR